MAALGLFGAQALMSGANAYTQSSAMRAQGAFQGQQLDAQARLAELDAQDIKARAKRDAEDVKKDAKGLIGRQRASLAGQGVDVNEGSALMVQEDTAAQAELEAMTLKNNAWRQAYGLKMEAKGLRFQGEMARQGSKYGARATLLTGGMQAARAMGDYGVYKAEQDYRAERDKLRRE